MENNIVYKNNGYDNGSSVNYINEETTSKKTEKNWCTIKEQISYILGQAELDWLDYSTGRQLYEGDKNPDGSYRMLYYLEEYWKGVRGTTQNPPPYQNINPQSTAIYSAKSHRSNGIWSASFVSWVMRTAGIKETDGFAFSIRHITYIVQALSNARKQDVKKNIWLVEASEPVEAGDILCFNRKKSNGNMTNHTLNGLARKYLDTTNEVKDLNEVREVSHCDVVKEIVVENNKKFAIVVGGNKGKGTVKSKKIPLTSSNIVSDAKNVKNPGSCFGIIKLGKSCTESITEVNNESYQENYNSIQNQLSNSVGLNATNNYNDVITIQRLLINKGYQIRLNGIINNNPSDQTVISILNFQTNNSLRITGNINLNDETFNLLSRQIQLLTESDDESVHQPLITNSYFFRRNAANPGTLNVIFEGDSWLDYPVPRVLDLYDTISDKNRLLNLNTLHLAKFGETTSNMIADKANFTQYISSHRIDRIYFSGGGNDVFPQLGRIVKSGVTTFNSSFFTDASKLSELKRLSGDDLYRKCISYKHYLNTTAFEAAMFNSTSLTRIFSTIFNNYLAFGSIMNTYGSPNLIFYMHTYDYPLYKIGVQPTIATVNLPLGPWIKPAFDSLGITDEILRSYVIIRLLDKFYSLLYTIKTNFMIRGYRFTTNIIDYRGLLNSSNYWRDEIHPNSLGAQRLATKVTF